MTTLLQELVAIIELLVSSMENGNPTGEQTVLLEEVRSKLARLKS
jgi:hypothetical protein